MIVLANIIFGDVPFLYAILLSTYNQLCLGIIVFVIGFVLRPADVFLCESVVQQHGFICAKAKRQQHGFICAKAKRQQHGFVCAKAKRQQHGFVCAKA